MEGCRIQRRQENQAGSVVAQLPPLEGVCVHVLPHLPLRAVHHILHLLNWDNTFLMGLMLKVNKDNAGLAHVVGLVNHLY